MNEMHSPSDMKSQWASRSRVASVVVLAVPLAIYLAFANKNYGWDATMFILQIADGTSPSLFHPHHLLYNPLGYIILEALEGIGISPSTASIMQIVNSIAGAVGVLVFFRILLKLSDRVGLSAIFALLLAFSMAYWEYTVEVEVYVIPAVLLLTSLLLMMDHLSGEGRPGRALLFKLGLLTSFACLFHQMHILFFFVVFTFVVLRVKSGWQRVTMFGVYLVPFTVLVCGGYIAAAQVTGNLTSLGSFWYWITRAFHAGAGWGTLDLGNFPSAAYGLFKTFFCRSETRDFLLTGTIDENGIGILAVLAAGGLLLAVLAAFTIVNFKSVYRSHRSLTLVLVIWLVVYGFFCVWFDPYTHEFWIPLLPPIWILIFLAIHRWQPIEHRSKLWPRLKTAIPVVLLVLLASVNFAGDVLPNSNIDNNENYQLASKFNGLGVDEEDLVLIWGPVPLENYYRLFFSCELQVSSLAERPQAYSAANITTITKEEWFTAHERVIEGTLSQGGRVFISENELTPSSRESLAFLGERGLIKISDYPVFYAKYEDRLVPVFSYKWRSKETRMFEIKGGC